MWPSRKALLRPLCSRPCEPLWAAPRCPLAASKRARKSGRRGAPSTPQVIEAGAEGEALSAFELELGAAPRFDATNDAGARGAACPRSCGEQGVVFAAR